MASDKLFSFPTDRTLVGFEYAKFATPGSKGKGTVKAARGAALPLAADASLADQFFVFQFSSQTDGPAILDSVNTEPGIIGSDAEPDVLVALEMLSFHVGQSEDI